MGSAPSLRIESEGRSRLARALVLSAIALTASSCVPSTIHYRYLPRLSQPGSDLRAALSIASGYQAEDGNSVTLLENGDEAFPAMLEAIRGAQRTIHFENNIMRDSEITRTFVEALAERARAGVKVRMLIDYFGAAIGAENEEKLAEAGVKYVVYRPFSLKNLEKIHLRTHRKLLIVDGKVGFTGGMCWDDAWMGNADAPGLWRDTQIRVEGLVVATMQVTFARVWAEATGEILSSRHLFAAEPAGDTVCQVMDSVPGSATNPARLSFLVATYAARRSIDVTNSYFVPGHQILDALMDAARRGVRVRLILPSRNIDLAAIRYAGRSYYNQLLEAGVEIYEFQPAQLHAKTMVVDGEWASVGSTNLNNRSFAYNFESNINIFDPRFAAEMTEMFERDLAQSKKIVLEEWVKRPFGEKVRETFYSMFDGQF